MRGCFASGKNRQTPVSSANRKDRQYRRLGFLRDASESGTKESPSDRPDMGLFPCVVCLSISPGRLERPHATLKITAQPAE